MFFFCYIAVRHAEMLFYATAVIEWPNVTWNIVKSPILYRYSKSGSLNTTAGSIFWIGCRKYYCVFACAKKLWTTWNFTVNVASDVVKSCW